MLMGWIGGWSFVVHGYAIIMKTVLRKILGGVYDYVIGMSGRIGMTRRLLVRSFFLGRE